MPKFNKNKVALLLLSTLLILSLLFVNMNLPLSASESEPIYLHGPPLTPIHMHSNESLVPIHMNSNMTLTPVHMHYVGDPAIDPIYFPWETPWHELYPEFCQDWILSSWEDHSGDGILSPNDQIDMTNLETGNVTWYHVDRVTWTLYLMDEFGKEMFIEYKGSFEPSKDPITDPVCTYWHEVYPKYSNVYHIVGIDPLPPLEYCKIIWLDDISTPEIDPTPWHVEDVARDLILREKIMDPISTWWHEIYPDYSKEWHITSWEDNGDKMLSPSDQIDMADTRDSWKWETFWSMGDVNEDGLIDFVDFLLIYDHYCSGDPQYDINKDGHVDYEDMWICGNNTFLDIWNYYSPWTRPPYSGKKEWYHVDRVTITLNVTFGLETVEWMKIELKTLYFEEMYNALKYPVDTRWHEVYPYYSNVYELVWWDWFEDDNCNGVLDVCDYIWLYNMSSPQLEPERYHVEDICYDIILNKKIANPVCTGWHELYPEYCQGWHLTSWEDNQLEGELGYGLLSPCDQIDMLTASDFWKWETFWSMGDVNRDGYIQQFDLNLTDFWFGWKGPPGVHHADLNKDGYVDTTDYMRCLKNQGLDIWTYYPDLGKEKWYHVDRVTLTLKVYNEMLGELYLEFKGPFEDIYLAKIKPVSTLWHEVWPYYSEVWHIVNWTDNCNGVLDYCDYIQLESSMGPLQEPLWFHVEDLAIDIILNEKITDPVCTWWHELYPNYCTEHHIIGWEDNGDGLLSPCDTIDLDPLGKGYHVEEVTLTLFVTPDGPGEPMYIEFEGGFEYMYQTKTEPVCTIWHEVWPEFCLYYHLTEWIDDCNGVLSYCDWIFLEPVEGGQGQYWHIEEVAIDIIVAPPPIHDVAVTYVASRYPWVYQGLVDPVDVTVVNEGDYTETVDVYAFYDGNLAAPKQTVVLNPGQTASLTFSWLTRLYDSTIPDWYIISANATILIDDDPADNVRIGNEELVVLPPPLYWKAAYRDYAPSGMPDFDQRQDAWDNPPGSGMWSWCAPTAVANSLWWYDSKYETNPIPPPTMIDNYPLVTSYAPGVWDDHDPLNVPQLIMHLAYLMDTDGQRTGLPHFGTTVWDMQAGIAHYLSWSTVNPLGDVNGDGTVDATDLNIVNAAMGTSPGVVGWDMRADIWPVTIGWPGWGPADNIIDINDQALVLANMGLNGTFYEQTVQAPEFPFIEEEIERSEDVILMLGFWYFDGEFWWREEYPYEYESGHCVTAAGVNSTTMEIAISDPIQDNAEAGGLGRVYPPPPHPHPPAPPDTVHNDASYISHDIYPVTMISPPLPPCPGGNWTLINYPGAPPGWFTVIENAVITSPLGKHDVAVTDITILRDILPRGQCLGKPEINVTVENQGDFPETFYVTVYGTNTTVVTVGTQQVILNPGENTTLQFDWDTSGIPPGLYTISASADVVPGETAPDQLDNTLSDGTIDVRFLGDAGAEHNVVDGSDVVIAIEAVPSVPGHLKWNSYADMNCDDVVDGSDIVIIIEHVPSHYP